MARLRVAEGCPWDREQDHQTLRWHAVEEVYELIDAIEAGDDHEMVEELGDLLLQVVFHCQLAPGARRLRLSTRSPGASRDKLIRRHPHVFGDLKVKDVDQVWANWEKIKRAEKHGTRHARPSALDGIPKHLPALLRAEKLVKKARRAKLLPDSKSRNGLSRAKLGRTLFELARQAQEKGWSAEDLLRAETLRHEKTLRKAEAAQARKPGSAGVPAMLHLGRRCGRKLGRRRRRHPGYRFQQLQRGQRQYAATSHCLTVRGASHLASQCWPTLAATLSSSIRALTAARTRTEPDFPSPRYSHRLADLPKARAT